MKQCTKLIEGTISEEGNGWYGTSVGDTVYCLEDNEFYEIVKKVDIIHTEQWKSNWINVTVKRCDSDADPEMCASLKVNRHNAN